MGNCQQPKLLSFSLRRTDSAKPENIRPWRRWMGTRGRGGDKTTKMERVRSWLCVLLGRSKPAPRPWLPCIYARIRLCVEPPSDGYVWRYRQDNTPGRNWE